MAYQPLEDLLPRSGNSIYKLVVLAANRAMELADGKPRLIEKTTSEKTATIALEEILAGKVEIKGLEGQVLPPPPATPSNPPEEEKEKEEANVA